MWSESERTAILVLSSFGAVFNNALYLSQIPMLLRIRKEGDSTRYPFLPSLTLMVSRGTAAGRGRMIPSALRGGCLTLAAHTTLPLLCPSSVRRASC